MGDIMPKISDTINDRVLKAMQREGLTIRSVSPKSRRALDGVDEL